MSGVRVIHRLAREFGLTSELMGGQGKGGENVQTSSIAHLSTCLSLVVQSGQGGHSNSRRRRVISGGHVDSVFADG